MYCLQTFSSYLLSHREPPIVKNPTLQAHPILSVTPTTTTSAMVTSWTAWEEWTQCQKEGVHVIRNRVCRHCDGSGSTDVKTENETCQIGNTRALLQRYVCFTVYAV